MFRFLALFHLSSGPRHVIRVTFSDVCMIQVLLRFPYPIFRRKRTIIHWPNERSRFRRLRTKNRFHCRPFVTCNVFQKNFTTLRRRTFANGPLNISNNAYRLTRRFLRVIFMIFGLFHFKRVSYVFNNVRIHRTYNVLTRKGRIFPSLHRRPIRHTTRLSFLTLRMAPIYATTRTLLRVPMFLHVHRQRDNLISIRRSRSFPLTRSFMRLLLYFKRNFMYLAKRRVFQIVTIRMLIPLMPIRQRTIFLLRCYLSALLYIKRRHV